MENPEDQKSESRAWEMLGKKRPPTISPFFSRNVLREARKTQQTGIHFHPFSWLRVGVPMAASLMLLLGVILWNPSSFLPASKVGLADTTDPAIDFDTVKNLDLLVFSEESTLWTDSSSF
ncbi:MAG: hypothetical protein ABI615_11315 [Chthoniobacterales bacterium]